MRHVALLLVAGFVVGCGSGGPSQITIGAARTYALADFTPARPSKSLTQHVSFVVDQPSGAALTRYRTGPGPHTGVHLVFVRSDLGAIVHLHPPIGSDGRISTVVRFPTPGRYRMVADVYPAAGQVRNFQLARWLRIPGRPPTTSIAPYRPSVTVDGYRFVVRGSARIHAIQATYLTFDVTTPAGARARFTPWYGALAHAIFFRAGTLDYFHTHVCGAGTAACTSSVGGPRVVGSSTHPGVLHVGVLVPVAGTWRLFLQCNVGGRVLTAPFTLRVR